MLELYLEDRPPVSKYSYFHAFICFRDRFCGNNGCSFARCGYASWFQVAYADLFHDDGLLRFSSSPNSCQTNVTAADSTIARCSEQHTVTRGWTWRLRGFTAWLTSMTCWVSRYQIAKRPKWKAQHNANHCARPVGSPSQADKKADAEAVDWTITEATRKVLGDMKIAVDGGNRWSSHRT